MADRVPWCARCVRCVVWRVMQARFNIAAAHNRLVQDRDLVFDSDVPSTNNNGTTSCVAAGTMTTHPPPPPKYLYVHRRKKHTHTHAHRKKKDHTHICRTSAPVYACVRKHVCIVKEGCSARIRLTFPVCARACVCACIGRYCGLLPRAASKSQGAGILVTYDRLGASWGPIQQGQTSAVMSMWLDIT